MNIPRRRAVLAAAVAVLVALPLLGFTAAYAYAGDVPRGTRVLGVDLGAMSRAEAAEALTAALGARAEELAAPVEVRLGEVSVLVEPESVGLAVDVEATVDAAAASRGWNPLPALFGSQELEPVVVVDVEQLVEALREPAQEAGEAMTLPEITFDGVTPVPVYPEPGLGLDAELAAQALTAAWPRREQPAQGWVDPIAVRVPLVETHPVTTAEEVDRLLEELARPAVAAPVTITTAAGELSLAPEVVADSLRLTADAHGEIVPEVDPKRLRKGLAEQLAEVETPPRDADIRLIDGRPQVVPGEPGELVDTAALARDLLPVLAAPAPRSVTAEMTEVNPEVGEAEIEELGIVEEVSTFTTYFDGGLSSPRSQNIVRVAEMVDGALVRPGEVFSLNEHTGERNYAKGFQDAPVIIGGRLQPGVGGGVSQFTTTLFNAAYYAGLEDVEHHPHTIHYTRYPPVIEATIFYPTLDLKFRNDTDYGILIDTSYTEGSVTVTLWGTKVWDEVKTEWSAKRDITRPRTMYVEPGPTCIATVGIDGFTQDAWRVFYRDGIEVRREKFTWRYDPQPQVICGEAPADDDR